MQPHMMNDKYTIEKLLGKGGMGSVYVVYDHHVQSYWAMKVISKEKQARYEIFQEIEMLKQLHHPKLPRVIDVLENEEDVMIIMDYMQGVNLNQYILCNGRANLMTLIDWGLQLTDVLSYLHQQDPMILYLDLKPDNIIIKQNQLYLIDFGIAQTKSMQKQIRYGSVGYAAPEQFDDASQLDQQADIYAFGMTLLYAYTMQIEKIPKGKKKLEKKVGKLIEKCVQKDKSKRYQTMKEVEMELQSFQSNRKKQPMLLLFCVFLFVLLFGLYSIQQTSRTYLRLAAISDTSQSKQVYIEQAIQKDPFSIKAYRLLFDDYLKDRIFSHEEELHFTSHIEPFITNRKEHPILCYKIACLYQYFDGELDFHRIRKVYSYLNDASCCKNEKIKQEVKCYKQLFFCLLQNKIDYHAYYLKIKETLITANTYLLHHYALTQLTMYFPSFDEVGIHKKEVCDLLEEASNVIQTRSYQQEEKNVLQKQIEDLNLICSD